MIGRHNWLKLSYGPIAEQRITAKGRLACVGCKSSPLYKQMIPKMVGGGGGVNFNQITMYI